MARHKYRPDLAGHVAELRAKAQAKLQGVAMTSLKLAPELSRLVHELEVHHFELVMQNEDLRCARAENEASLARYAALFDFAPIGYATLSAEGVISDINYAGARLLGRERGLIVRKNFDVYVLARHLWTWENLLQTALQSGHSEMADIELWRVDTPVVARLTACVNEQAERFVLLALEDIADQRKLQLQLATAEQALELALRDQDMQQRQISESLRVLVWVCSPEGACNYLNQRWIEYTGVHQYPQQGSGWLDGIHPEDRERARAAWETAIAAGAPFEAELRLRSESGDHRWFELHCTPIRDALGTVVKWYGIASEIQGFEGLDEDRIHRTQGASVLVEVR